MENKPLEQCVRVENAVAQGHTAALNEMRSDPTYIAALARANSQAEIDAIGKKYKPLEQCFRDNILRFMEELENPKIIKHHFMMARNMVSIFVIFSAKIEKK